MEEPVLQYDSLRVGQRFPAVPCSLTDAFLDAYLQATGETHPLFVASPAGSGYAPPLCTGLVRFVKGSLGGRWPTGTVHLSQETRLCRPLRRGEALVLDVEVGQKYRRNGRQYIEFIATTRDQERRVAVQSRMLMLWAGATQAAAQGSTSTIASRRTTRESALPATGRRLTPVTARFSRAKLEAYGRLAGAQDAIHLDPLYAKQTRFGRNIAPGLLVLTLLSRLMTQAFAERWLATGCVQVRFVKPAFVEDQVTAHGVILNHTDTGCAIWCENQLGVTVIAGHASVSPPGVGPRSASTA